MQNPDNPSGPEALFDSFWTPEFEESLGETVLTACKWWSEHGAEVDAPKDRESHYLKSIVLQEKMFLEPVFQALAKWTKEESPVVLWDVDLAIGSDIFDPNLKEYFGFRPSFIPFLEFCEKNFPNIKMGILSGRWNLEEEIQDPKQLLPMARFLDKKFVLSASEPLPEEEARVMAKQTGLPFNSMARSSRSLIKYHIIGTLRSSGVNAKLIDDDIVANKLSDNGLRVPMLTPQTETLVPGALYLQNQD